MLEVKNASIVLGGKTLFEHLSFTVTEGEMLCITGDSGRGKTTLLRAMMGFLPLNEGLISIDGELLTPSSSEYFRRNMSYLPQEIALPYSSIQEAVNIPFALKINQGRTFSRAVLMKEWQELELSEDLYEKKLSEVSGGQKQRIMLAVCRLLDKRIVLVDEPTSALDAHTSTLVCQYLLNMAQQGKTVVVVSHDTTLINAANKRIIL